jgi:hypothetical protein
MALATSNPNIHVLKNKAGRTQSTEAVAYAFLTLKR